jgi:hypothetical protein
MAWARVDRERSVTRRGTQKILWHATRAVAVIIVGVLAVRIGLHH